MSKDNDLMSGFTTKFSLGSFFNTINPLSRLAGNSLTQYVPQWLINAIAGSKNVKGQKLHQATQTASLISKVVGASTAAGLLTWLIRSATQKADDFASKSSKTNKASRTAAGKLQSQFKKPTKAFINKEDEEQVSDRSSIDKKASAYGLLSVALPTTSAVVTALSVLAMTDKAMDASYSKKLDSRRRKLQQKLDDAMLQRIYRNRGVQSAAAQQPIQNKPLQKQAKQQVDRSIIGLSPIQAVAGLGMLAIAFIAAKAGYQYDRRNNPAVIKFKANQKGLKSYVKARQAQQNVYNTALDQNLVAKLDSGLTGKAPEVQSGRSYKELDI